MPKEELKRVTPEVNVFTEELKQIKQALETALAWFPQANRLTEDLQIAQGCVAAAYGRVGRALALKSKGS